MSTWQPEPALYSTYRWMMKRCYYPKNSNYAHYGGRGIGVWPQWRDDRAAFVAWIEQNLGPRPDGCSLDRIDNDGNYEPGNLRWATPREQNLNQRKPKPQTSRPGQVQSGEMRRRLPELLSEVEHGGVVEVSRWKIPVAVMVPPDWYRRAAEALGEPASDC